MNLRARGGAHRPLARWALLGVLLAGCSGEMSGEGEPFGAGGDGQEGGSGGSGGSAVGSGGSDGGTGGVMTGTGGTGGVIGGGGGSGGNPIEPPPGSIPMFVAQGKAGRTIISCDDGRSWVADQSDRGWKYCESNDCDHDSGAGRGVTWAEGWFFVTFGWGAPGSVRRSRDGVSWEPVLEGEVFGGIVYGNGRLLAAHKYSRYSDDLGDTWQDPGVPSISGQNVRAAAFVPHGGGRFLIAASSSTTSEIVYSDDGITWEAPEALPSSCAAGVRLPGRIAYGNGTIVTMGEDGVVCRSTDGGHTWTSQSIATRLRGNGIWTGSEFMTWDRGRVYRSSDGDTWTETVTVPGDVDPGIVAIGDNGTIAAITAGNDQHYDSQLAYRSEDGIHWEILPESRFTQGHPMRAMTFGYGQPSDHCP